MEDRNHEIKEFVNSNHAQIRGAALASVRHLKEMYPAAFEAVPETAQKSLANFITTQVQQVMDEVVTRLVERVVYIPFEDEPTFILLARDPQAPGLVERWVTDRNMYEPHEKEKINRATETAGKMREWKEANPDEGMPITAIHQFAQLGNKEVKDNEGTVTLTSIFAMPALNKHLTLLRLYKGGGSEYLMHAMDGSNHGASIVGFLTKEDLVELRDSLNKEFPNA